ncbi:MAG: GAF domain-containing sensor histidine kinase, partial [Ktedonobacterales bacterium]|nr:GAF domain-containing sensor histidine kinase [Ktedonobacterales bacterium]
TEGTLALPTTPTERVFPGTGEMAERMRALDWSQTPLGPVEDWPQPLRAAVNICLSSRFPIVLWWGPDLRLLYNDAWRPALGALKHPALGKPGREVWAEVWHIIGPQLESVLATGEATWSDDQILPMDRYGYVEETYWTYSYSPIRLETGAVGGIFTSVNETTPRVLGERRTRAARDLAAAIVDARTTDEVCERAAQVLERTSADVPFALLYLIDQQECRARLAAHAGIAADHPLAPALVNWKAPQEPEGHAPVSPALNSPARDATGDAALWPLAHIAQTGQRQVVAHLEEQWDRWDGVPVNAGPEMTPHTALVLPVIEPGQAAPSAVLVAGVSPRRALDNEYEGFFELLASHLAAGLASAHAHEEERRRAEVLAAMDRAKTTFFSNVSHEFRTPLTLMLGPLEDVLARSVDLPPTERKELDLVHRNGLRLLKLVNTLLDFARIEAGRTQANYVPTDLATFTTELTSSFRSLVEHAGVRLVVNCPPLDEPVYVDRDMWEKIVLNLLSNAFKFTFEGEIAVNLRRASGEDDHVELTVRDTGIGIPAAELPRLFERFHRVEGAQARTHEGSGIGLALVRELVHLHGGTIQVESAEGMGTSFSIHQPVGTAHLPAEYIQTVSALASTALGAA